jgi:hypothetical protein
VLYTLSQVTKLLAAEMHINTFEIRFVAILVFYCLMTNDADMNIFLALCSDTTKLQHIFLDVTKCKTDLDFRNFSV